MIDPQNGVNIAADSCFRVGVGSKSAKKNVSSGSSFTQKMSQRVKGKTGEMVTDSGENSGKRAVMNASERKIRRSERLD